MSNPSDSTSELVVILVVERITTFVSEEVQKINVVGRMVNFVSPER